MRSAHQQKGMAALFIALAILFAATLIVFFSTRVIVTDNKIYNNVKNKMAAENAAQAGIDYALAFLNSSLLNQEAVISTNAVTTTPAGIVTSSLAGCNVLTNTATVTSPGALTNGATYTMTFACVALNNTNSLTLTSTGTSADGSSVRTITVVVARVQAATVPLISGGAVNLGNRTRAYNTVSGATIAVDSGGVISIGTGTPISVGNPATTTCNNIANIPPGVCTAVIANDATLTGVSAATFETRYVGNAISTLCSTTYVDYVVDCTGGGNRTYRSSTLAIGSPSTGAACSVTAAPGVVPANPTISSLSRRTVCFNMGSNNLTFENLTVGSANAPDIILINQSVANNFTLDQNVELFGGYYSNSSINHEGNGSTVSTGIIFTSDDYTQGVSSEVDGVVVARLTPNITGSNTYITRTTSANNGTAVASGSLLGYAIVPGSWKDF